MGLYKICIHKDDKKAVTSCVHDWHGRFMHNGTNVRKNLVEWTREPLRNKQQATEAFDRFRTAVRRGVYSPLGEGVLGTVNQAKVGQTFAAVAGLYIERHVKRTTRGHSVEGVVQHNIAYFGDRVMAEITTDDVEDYIETLREPAVLGNRQKLMRKRKVGTLNRYKASLRHLWNWAIEKDLAERSPFYKGIKAIIKTQYENNKRTRRLTQQEEDTLLQAAASHLKPLICCALDSGLRRAELRRLTWADLAESPDWIRVRGTADDGEKLSKSGKTRWVPATQRFLEMVAPLRVDGCGKLKRLTAPVFSDETSRPLGLWWTAFVAACRRAGIEGLVWHDLRHEFASRLADDGRPVPQIQELLGHSDIKTTMRYISVTKEDLMASVRGAETRKNSKQLAQRGQTSSPNSAV